MLNINYKYICLYPGLHLCRVMVQIHFWPSYRTIAAVDIFHQSMALLPKFSKPAEMRKHLPPGDKLKNHVQVTVILKFSVAQEVNRPLLSPFSLERFWIILFLLTLKWYSKLTKKGKLIACRILFSFNVCSTCFNLTT